jgi:predicted ArsR family transcriptional regulator
MEGWSFLTEYPQSCKAETEAFGRLLGTPVQCLATIAHGDGICAAHVTAPSLVQHPQYHDRHRHRRNNN